VAILLVYSLVDEKYRFSRALIIMGSVWAFLILMLFRLVLHGIKIKRFRLDIKQTKRVAIVGHSDEIKRVKQLLENTPTKIELAGFIGIDPSDSDKNYIGQIGQLSEIIRINRIDEIVFCAESISSTDIIKAMLELTQLDVDYKIAPPQSISIIGSNSIHTAGDLYVVNVNAISKAANKRKKRIFDLGVSIILLFTIPVNIWFLKEKPSFISNILNVLAGRKTWIGYINEKSTFEHLPVLRVGVLNPADLFTEIELDNEKIKQLNILYAKDYSILNDMQIVTKAWKNLDKS
jgi:hypothetical protein